MNKLRLLPITNIHYIIIHVNMEIIFITDDLYLPIWVNCAKMKNKR